MVAGSDVKGVWVDVRGNDWVPPVRQIIREEESWGAE